MDASLAARPDTPHRINEESGPQASFPLSNRDFPILAEEHLAELAVL
jgi:hypothetical protein